MIPRGRMLQAGFVFCAALVVTAIVYWPGLSGGFLFDDFANLIALGRYGGVSDWDSLLRYLTSGIADPTGRPVSMLTFLIDARNWPADPWPFKRTNVAIHLLNGAMLYSVLAALGSRLKQLTPPASRWAAAIAAALWLLHPLWVSTVLYIVQRQAMLAALFVLCGIRAWIASRSAFDRDDKRAGWAYSMIAIPMFGTLAGLSKANGFLLPLLVCTLELTVLRASTMAGPGPLAERHRTWARRLLCTLPTIGVFGGLLTLLVANSHFTISTRPWTVGERLLSEPRVIFEYLQLLLLPTLRGRGLFADDIEASSGWIHPWSTLPAIIGLVGLLTIAFLWRRRHPVISAALLFFLAGHLLESSVIPLELYFEHRNYLPAMLLFWPVGVGLLLVPRYLPYSSTAVVAFLCLALFMTATEARLWGRPDRLALAWAADRPDSPRAQANAASVEMSSGRPRDAIRRLAPLVVQHPDEPQYALNLLDAYCMTGQVPDRVIASAISAFSRQGVQLDISYQWLARLMTPGVETPCAGLPVKSKQGFVKLATRAVESDPEFVSRAQRISALSALSDHRCSDALDWFDRRLDSQKRPEFAHDQVGLLATHCGPAAGLAHLDYFLGMRTTDSLASSPILRMRDELMRRQRYWQNEWTRLRQVLLADMSVARNAPKSTDIPDSPSRRP